MSEKVKLTAKQAEKIADFQKQYSNDKIVSDFVTSDPEKREGLSIDELIRALYIGYEVKSTPEEKIRDFYHTKAVCDMHPHHAIQHVLNILNIKIEGVNT